MEAKNSGNVTEAGVAVAPNKNLVIRFVEYAFDVLNNRMDEFFEDSMNSFDQDLSELRDGSGETLEQYEIYQKYLKLLELKFDEFATDEGYESSTQCFDEINDLICNDEIERKKIFKEMSERMMAAFQNFQQQIQDGAEAGAGEDDGKKGEKGEEEEDVKSEKKSSDVKGSGRKIKDSKESKGDDEADDEADAKGTSHQQVQDTAHAQASPAPPVMMFFQPVSLDSMLQHVLSLTEYTTFSTIIRTKLKQKQLFMSLQDRVSSQSKNTSKRQRSLEHNEHFEEIYEELIQRICDFAPNQTNFQNQIRSHLNLKSWKELLAAGENGEEITPEEKLLFKRITMNVSMAIWNFVAINEQAIVRQALTIFLPKIDQLQSNDDLKIAAGNFLSMAHGLVDKTEKKMLASMQEYYDRHSGRKNQSKDSDGGGGGYGHEEKESHRHHPRAESK